MNCDELLPRLPLLALEECDPPLAAEAADHVRECPRCQARFAELTRTRDALALATVAGAAPLDGATIRATGRPRALPRLLRGWRNAAAAAVLLGVALGAGFLGGSWSEAARARPVAAASGIPPAALAQAILALDERLGALEQRHDRDLLALAQAVDRQQLRRDEGVAREIATLARATRAQLIDTRLALDDVAQLIPSSSGGSAIEQEH